MQSVSSRIWTRVAVSISYDDNDYTTGAYNAWYAIKPKQTKPNIFIQIKSLLKNRSYKVFLVRKDYICPSQNITREKNFILLFALS